MGKTVVGAMDVIYARKVLWHLGDYPLGFKTRPWEDALIRSIRFALADGSPAARDYLAGVREQHPEFVHLMEVFVGRGYEDVEPLRRFVKTHDESMLEVLGA